MAMLLGLRYDRRVRSTATGRQQRAKARANWPIRRYALGTEPDENIWASTTPTERLAMMWELSQQAWTLSGNPLPTYPRRQAPGRMIRSRQ